MRRLGSDDIVTEKSYNIFVQNKRECGVQFRRFSRKTLVITTSKVEKRPPAIWSDEKPIWMRLSTLDWWVMLLFPFFFANLMHNNSYIQKAIILWMLDLSNNFLAGVIPVKNLKMNQLVIKNVKYSHSSRQIFARL